MSLVFGHGEGQLWALSPHPTESIFATGSYDKNLVVWNISAKVIEIFILNYRDF
jgi:WD40 repeat protein